MHGALPGSALGSIGEPWISHPPRLRPPRPPRPSRRPRRPTTPQPAAQSEPRSAGFGSRGRLRRRARFLRKARELAYRDLGGLVYSLHRFGQRNDSLVLAKLATLTRIDAELRGLEASLSERQPVTVLREAGITACPRCAAIHSGEDRFCPNCGLPMSRSVDLPIAGAAATAGAPPTTPAPQAAPAPSARAARTGLLVGRHRIVRARPGRAHGRFGRRRSIGRSSGAAGPRGHAGPPRHAARATRLAGNAGPPASRPAPGARRCRRATRQVRRRRSADRDHPPAGQRLVTVAAAPAGPTPGGASPGPPTVSVDPHLPAAQRPAGTDACPLCGTPLSPEQDWCLRCGAAARTRLAATPNWKAPIAVIAVVAVLALGVLAAALVKLSGDSSSSPAPITTTVPAPDREHARRAGHDHADCGRDDADCDHRADHDRHAPPAHHDAEYGHARRQHADGAAYERQRRGRRRRLADHTGSLDKSTPKLTPAEREALRRLSPGTAGK